MWQRAFLLKIPKSWFSAMDCHSTGPLGHSIVHATSKVFTVYQYSGIDCRQFFLHDTAL